MGAIHKSTSVGCYILQRAKMSLNAKNLLFYCVLCQFIHSFVFPKMAGRGTTVP